MGKLHELISVKEQVASRSKALTEEAFVLFKKKQDHLEGFRSVYEPFAEDALDQEDDTKPVDTTVEDKLNYIFESIIKTVDVKASQDATNQKAKADLVVDGVKLLEDVTATTLLSLEQELRGWFNLIEAVPTLEPGLGWVPDEGGSPGVFVSTRPNERFRQEKTTEFKEVSPSTEFHPAQIETWTKDVKVGKITKTFYSGKVSVAKKSEWLDRISSLIVAAKKARQRANGETVVKVNIGKTLKDFVFSTNSN